VGAIRPLHDGAWRWYTALWPIFQLQLTRRVSLLEPWTLLLVLLYVFKMNLAKHGVASIDWCGARYGTLLTHMRSGRGAVAALVQHPLTPGFPLMKPFLLLMVLSYLVKMVVTKKWVKHIGSRQEAARSGHMASNRGVAAMYPAVAHARASIGGAPSILLLLVLRCACKWILPTCRATCIRAGHDAAVFRCVAATRLVVKLHASGYTSLLGANRFPLCTCQDPTVDLLYGQVGKKALLEPRGCPPPVSKPWTRSPRNVTTLSKDQRNDIRFAGTTTSDAWLISQNVQRRGLWKRGGGCCCCVKRQASRAGVFFFHSPTRARNATGPPAA
jgi:hypothetical protein